MAKAKQLRYAFIGDAKSLVNATKKSDSALGKLARSAEFKHWA